MTKVKVHHQGPAAESEGPRDPLSGQATTHVVTDPRGRVLTIKKLTALDRMRLAILAGAETAENPAAMMYINLASSLTAIDGEVIIPAQTMRQVEARVHRLDEDGLGAILEGWLEAGWLGDRSPGVDAQAAHEDAVKN